MPYSVLIVDDEPLAREGLHLLLQADGAFRPIHKAGSGPEALSVLQSQTVDVVFLDIQMPEMEGFETLRHIAPAHMPEIVFVTAHDRYAIDAFEINAVDYLLKPVSRQRFADSILRLKNRLAIHDGHWSSSQQGQQIADLIASMTQGKTYVGRLAVKQGSKTSFVLVEDIEWISAAENYVELHVGSSQYLVHASMNNIEKNLDPKLFIRIHRSLIVKLKSIQELQPTTHGEYIVTLRGGIRLQSGRSYSAQLKQLMSNPF